ncbi:hypothetical protein LWI29_001671 [Acer saccharum]|uniref:Uncharacterized protein n=1 Tax=Acer saccharum TaxID=4024 RepID=A0AA39T164_ACESA|nr:hypothetical protein LWI29_001671 [Acer saccharum]
MDSQIKHPVVVKVKGCTGSRGQVSQVRVKFLDDQNRFIMKKVKGTSERRRRGPLSRTKEAWLFTAKEDDGHTIANHEVVNGGGDGDEQREDEIDGNCELIEEEDEMDDDCELMEMSSVELIEEVDGFLVNLMRGKG